MSAECMITNHNIWSLTLISSKQSVKQGTRWCREIQHTAVQQAHVPGAFAAIAESIAKGGYASLVPPTSSVSSVRGGATGTGLTGGNCSSSMGTAASGCFDIARPFLCFRFASFSFSSRSKRSKSSSSSAGGLDGQQPRLVFVVREP